MGWDRMAIMMISQCEKTRNVAYNHQNLRESLKLFQHNKISFSEFKSYNHATLVPVC